MLQMPVLNRHLYEAFSVSVGRPVDAPWKRYMFLGGIEALQISSEHFVARRKPSPVRVRAFVNWNTATKAL